MGVTNARISGPKPLVVQPQKPGFSGQKSAPKINGITPNELDLNEGVVYTAGGIGVRKNKFKTAVSGGQHRVNSIASVGLNNPSVMNRPPTSSNGSHYQVRNTKCEPLISQTSIPRNTKCEPLISQTSISHQQDHGPQQCYIRISQRQNLRQKNKPPVQQPAAQRFVTDVPVESSQIDEKCIIF